jgi:adenosylmethionine-8-amino-7-oxononanoate aminotransferase
MARIASISAAHRGAVARFRKRKDVENVRSLGTIFALDVKDDGAGYLSQIGPKLYEFFMRHKVLLRPLGNTVYILPPYCITEEELENVYDIIDIALDHLRDGREQQAA